MIFYTKLSGQKTIDHHMYLYEFMFIFREKRTSPPQKVKVFYAALFRFRLIRSYNKQANFGKKSFRFILTL